VKDNYEFQKDLRVLNKGVFLLDCHIQNDKSMKKLALTTLFISLLNQLSFAQTTQTDSIFTHQGLVLANVKNIVSDVVEYVFPNEELIYTVNTNFLSKIRFKSGRLQMFTKPLIFNKINGVEDYEKVLLSRQRTEAQGLTKLDEFYGSLSNRGFTDAATVRERAMRKLKIQAAMLGGNLVIVNEEGNNNALSCLDCPRYNFDDRVVIGEVFTDRLPSITAFKNLIGSKNEFEVFSLKYIGNYHNSIQSTTFFTRKMVLEGIYEENNFTYLRFKPINNMRTMPQTARLIYFDNRSFIIQYKVDD
jgi:hypothetical protein